MESTQILELVGSLGFPIVMCFVLIKHITDERHEHKQETDQLRMSLENNTKVLAELTALLKQLTSYEKA